MMKVNLILVVLGIITIFDIVCNGVDWGGSIFLWMAYGMYKFLTHE